LKLPVTGFTLTFGIAPTLTVPPTVPVVVTDPLVVMDAPSRIFAASITQDPGQRHHEQEPDERGHEGEVLHGAPSVALRMAARAGAQK